MGTFSSYLVPARERHEAGRQAVNAGDYSGILDMLMAYPELAARAVAGGAGELSGYLGQSPTMQRKLADDLIGMMENTAMMGGGLSTRIGAKPGPRQTFSVRILDDGRPTQHVVHSTGVGMQYANSPSRWVASDTSSAYRITGAEQIKDMVQSGLVRSKPPGSKAKGGRTGVTHWSQGRDSLVYDWEGLPNSYIIKAPVENLNGRHGGIRLDELQGVYVYRNSKPTNILDELRGENIEISRAMNGSR